MYFKLLIDSFDPKVALGHDMNNKIFRFSKLFPEKISIAYQFAYIFKILCTCLTIYAFAEFLSLFEKNRFKKILLSYVFILSSFI